MLDGVFDFGVGCDDAGGVAADDAEGWAGGGVLDEVAFGGEDVEVFLKDVLLAAEGKPTTKNGTQFAKGEDIGGVALVGGWEVVGHELFDDAGDAEGLDGGDAFGGGGVEDIAGLGVVDGVFLSGHKMEEGGDDGDKIAFDINGNAEQGGMGQRWTGVGMICGLEL